MPIINGTLNDEVLVGTQFADEIRGLGGNNILFVDNMDFLIIA